ncbi:MAG: alpha/beta fold hydrolase [Acidobacteria bacterium]|nr:alpha/beta fold hydrolase [Acidobacteriota bacterium]
MTTAIMPGCEPFSEINGPVGVLVLHGFTGNPASMRPLAERIAKSGYSVELPRLPGHGTSIEDMMTTDWSDWSGAAVAAYDALRERCDRVGVVGLSMGGGLAAYVAQVRRDVAACVFINPLVKPPVQEMVDGLNALLESGLATIDSIGSDIKMEGPVEASYDATPLACAASLFEAMKSVNANLASITAPTLLLSSREDHVVTSDNGDDIVEKVSGPVERIWLEESYHVATMDNDREVVVSATISFFDRMMKP